MGNWCGSGSTGKQSEIRSIFITKSELSEDDGTRIFNEHDLANGDLKKMAEEGGHEQYFLKALVLGSECFIKDDDEEIPKKIGFKKNLDEEMVAAASRGGIVLTEYRPDGNIKVIDLSRSEEIWQEALIIQPERKMKKKKEREDEEEEEEKHLSTSKNRPTFIIQRVNKEYVGFGDVYVCLIGSRDEILPKTIEDDENVTKDLQEYLEKMQPHDPLFVAYKRLKREEWEEEIREQLMTEEEELPPIYFEKIEKELTLLGCVEFFSMD